MNYFKKYHWCGNGTGFFFKKKNEKTVNVYIY